MRLTAVKLLDVCGASFFFFLSDKLSDGMALEDRFRIQREEDVAPTANMYRRMRPP